ncbi:MAG TPA: hypothetical protein VMY69_00785 [Phycisphaerae bacterium]|nr:hypothetical protein [Phycisphaerae bacterium]
MSTTDKRPDFRGPYVTRDVCETIHAEQREANQRTWEELRTLRRLVILLVVGGQLFTGGLNVAGFGYWLQQHAAQPHPATVQMVATARAESREDLRDLRREIRDLVASVLARTDSVPPTPTRIPEGEKK